MAEFMIGTLADKPLKKVVLNEVTYFVDVEGKRVYKDEEKLPRVTDKELIKEVLEASK